MKRRTFLVSALTTCASELGPARALALGRTPLGGTLKLTLPFAGGGVDPHSATDPLSALFAPAIADPLYARDGDGKPYPALALDVARRDDAGTRVTLRAGLMTALGKRLDALIVRSVPRAKKAVKWNSPFYGLEGKGWFLSMHAFAKYMKLAFFRGTSLKPPPPGESTSKDVRYLDIREGDELDEAQLVKWLKQAAKLPGWNP